MQPTDHTSTVILIRARTSQRIVFELSNPDSRTGFCVALEAQHNLRRTVPSRGNILSHIPGILLGIDREATSKAEIADFQLTISIHKQIAGLQVSMQNVGGVDVLEAAEDLVNKGLEVGICKWLAGTDNSRQVAFHQLY